jgi:hypothetical protein
MLGKSTTIQQWIVGPLLCGALGISACAPARPPVTTVTRTEVTTVYPAGTSDPLPYAPVELQLARDELASARLALDAREYERASRLAEQAVLDARLAEVRAETESARLAARDLRLRSEALRDETIRVSTVYLPPSSPIELRLAREELDSARLSLEVREYERARRLAEQAIADARLAEVRAASEVSRRTARDLRLASEALRDTAARGSLASLPSYPPTELRLAREELESARLALEMREYERARRLAEQALEDARLAEVRAETMSTRLAARDLRLSIENLRYEAARLAALY